MARRIRRTCALLPLVLAVSGVAPKAWAEPRIGVSARAGIITAEWSPSGWWLEPGVRVDVPFSSIFGAAFEGGLAVSSSSIDNSLEYDDVDGEDEDVSSRLLLGAPLRAALVWRPGRVFSLELGAVAGLAWSQSDSTQCGEHDSEIDPLLGAYFGPAFHFGERDEIAVGAHVQAIVPGQLRCTNTNRDPVTGDWGPGWFDDDEPDPTLIGQLVYSFGK